MLDHSTTDLVKYRGKISKADSRGCRLLPFVMYGSLVVGFSSIRV